MVFGLFSQHLQEYQDPVAGKVASSPSHTILALTPTGAQIKPNSSMPAPPLPEEPVAWGFETPSAKDRNPARSPEALSGVKNLLPVLQAAAPTGDHKAGLKEPQPPVLLTAAAVQPPDALAVPVVSEVPGDQAVQSPMSPVPPGTDSPGARGPWTPRTQRMLEMSDSPKPDEKPAAPDVLMVPAPAVQSAEQLMGPCVPVDPAPGEQLEAQLTEPGVPVDPAAGVRSTGKPALQDVLLDPAPEAKGGNRKYKAKKTAGKTRRGAFGRLATMRSMCRKGQAQKEASDSSGSRVLDSVEAGAELAGAAEAGAGEAASGVVANANAKAAAKTVAPKARVASKDKVAPKAKVAPKDNAASKDKTAPKDKAAPKAKVAPKAKAKGKSVATKAKAKAAPMVATSTWAGRYVKQDGMWTALLECWTKVAGEDKSEKLKRHYWNFVQEFIKDKPGSFSQRISAAAKAWARTPEAREGRVKLAAVQARRAEKASKDAAEPPQVKKRLRKVKKVPVKVTSKRTRTRGQAADLHVPCSLGDEFSDDDAVPGVPGVPAPKTPDVERSEDEDTLPLTDDCWMPDVQGEGSHEASSGSGDVRLTELEAQILVGLVAGLDP